MRYYKSYTESHDGDEGEFFCEVNGDRITRHISIFNGTLYWATPSDEFDERYAYTDQTQFEFLDSEVEIPEGEFLELWRKALEQ